MAAQLLAAGHELIVHDARPDAARDLLAAGARWASSPADVATRADVVATCLPGPAEMEQVCLGPRGLAEGIRPGALYIDHTTNSPLLVTLVHRALGARGVDMLDAPVSGGMEGARTRDLLVMAGGDPAVFARARPVLDAVAKRVLYTGPIGSGSIAKIMHNCATFTLDLVMAECWTVAVKAGMAPDVIVDVFNQAALGHMMSLKVRLPATYLRGDFEPRFSLALAQKDLGLAVELARDGRADAPRHAVRAGDDRGDRAGLGDPGQLHLSHPAGRACGGRGAPARAGRNRPLALVGNRA
jgi:3-hydroxyisobutyrate dehydrogenase